LLLRRLVEYSDRIDMPPVMYAKTPIKWLIDLAPDGRFLGFVPLDGGRKQNDRGITMNAPDVGPRPGTGVKPKLLCDNGAYVLGLIPDGKKANRVEKQHTSFIRLTRKCANELNLNEIDAVSRFLDMLQVNSIDIPNDLDPGLHNMTFRINDEMLIDIPEIRNWWATYAIEGPMIEAQCVICSELRPCLAVHPIRIKGIKGGQQSGMAIISANRKAFTSYGHKQSMIAPTCLDCAARYANSLNHLLASESHSYKKFDTTFVFWTKEDSEFNVLDWLDTPDEGEVKELLRSGFTGKPHETIDSGAFYAAALSASDARVAVRDWIETTIPSVQANLAHWFRRQQMVDAWGTPGKPLGVYRLVASLYRDVTKEVVDAVPRLLIKSALTGSPLPDYLLYQAVKRMRADPIPYRNDKEDTSTLYARMMLIRLVFNSYPDKEENYMSELNCDNKEPAYLCGRLLAVLESIQHQAIPGAKATLIDRYYGAASAAPASVFGTLMRGAQPHLAKLRKENEGAYFALQGRIEEICAGLETYPYSLNMKEQAIFALGYYHQRADDRAKARAHAESKKNSGEAQD